MSRDLLEFYHSSCPFKQSAAMKSILVLLFLVALAQGVPTQKIAGRIVNGRDAKPGEIPYQVSIQNYRSSHFCGGSILNAYYVITAAHCVHKERPSNVKVIAGSIDLKDPKSTHRAAKLIVHEDYNDLDSWINDIGLIRVKKAFKVSAFIAFVPMPQPHEKVPTNSKAVTSGWGRAQLRQIFPDELQLGEVMIADQDYCRQMYVPLNETIHETNICAYNPGYVSGVCEGDSGGPLTVDGKLVGIASWMLSCDSITHPKIFTRVADYIDWIEAHVV